MFRIYVKLCHGVTVTRGWTGSGRQSKKQATPRVQTAMPYLRYASMALSRMHMATSHVMPCHEPRANGRVGCLVYLVYHARACEICDMRAGDSQRLMFVYPFLWRWFRLVRR